MTSRQLETVDDIRNTLAVRYVHIATASVRIPLVVEFQANSNNKSIGMDMGRYNILHG